MRRRFCLWVALGGLVWSGPAVAAEHVTLRLGPLAHTVTVTELEQFSRRGVISDNLRPFAPVLNSQMQQLLHYPWKIPPQLAERFIDDLLPTDDGQRILESLKKTIPEADLADLRFALHHGGKDPAGLNFLTLLRHYPVSRVTVDMGGVMTIAWQLKTTYLQNQLLSPWLAKELPKVDAPPQPSTINPTTKGSLSLQRRSWVLSDSQRGRFIPIDIYWGSADGQGVPVDDAPLVVISHGFAADRRFLSYLAEHLATHGAVVVAIEHPKSNIDWVASIATGHNPESLLPASEFIDRPKDVSFVLDRLEVINQRSPRLRGRLNTSKVTIIGHSLGGYTAFALAGGEMDIEEVRQFCQQRHPWQRTPADWFQCSVARLPEQKFQLQDTRIQQVIALNPISGRLFGKQGLSKINIPTLIFSATQDAVTPPVEHQLKAFQQIRGPKYLLTAIGGTHLSVSDPNYLNHNITSHTLMPELFGNAAQPIQQIVKGISLAMIKQSTPEAWNYNSFLSPAYVQSLSTPRLTFRWSTTLPMGASALIGIL